MGASQSTIQDPSITGINKIGDKLVFRKIDGTEDSIPIDTVSIQSVVVDNTGNLVITRTNGSKDGPFNIKGPKGDSIIGPKGDSIIGPKGDSITGPKGSDSTIPGPPGRDSALANGIPSGPGMYAIYDPTCNNDEVFRGVTGGAVNGICRGNTNFINHQGGGAIGGFRFLNFTNGTKNIVMETDGLGNLLVKGRDILKELDNCVKKDGKYKITERRYGRLLTNPGGVLGVGEQNTAGNQEASWTFSDSPAP
jgi:hypothetical protein